MNIIQLQDRLKGVPDQALVGYVENPTGDVPTYLALGELQRRKDMRERYQADKQPEPSVAEQLIEETKPQGIAGMAPGMAPPAQGVGAPQPQPEMTPDMLASSGVGALPAGNVGQNYVGGGIVAFENGGETSNYKYPPKGLFMDTPEGGFLSGEEYRQKIRDAIEGRPRGSKIGESTFMQRIYDTTETPYDEAIKAYERIGDTASADQLRKVRKDFIQFSDPSINPDLIANKTDPLDTGYDVDAAAKALGYQTEEEKLANTEKYIAEETKKRQQQEKDGTYVPPPNVSQDTTKQTITDKKESPLNNEKIKAIDVTADSIYNPYLDDTLFKDYERTEGDKVVADANARFRKLIGEDPAQARMQGRLKKYEDRQRKMEDTAIGEALMAAGFATMAGTSQNAFENFGAGAQRGLESYGKSRKDIISMEEKAYALDMELAKAERAEQLAATKYGLDSEQYNKAFNDKLKIQRIQSAAEVDKYKTLAEDKTAQFNANLRMKLDERKAKIKETYKDISDLQNFSSRKEAEKYLRDRGGRGEDAIQNALKEWDRFQKDMLEAIENYSPLTSAGSPTINPIGLNLKGITS